VTAAPTSREVFHTELVKVAGIARASGFLVPHAMALAAKVKPAQVRDWLKGAADPGNPWDRDRILTDMVNGLQINLNTPPDNQEASA
jgi:hypothetical protein